MGRDSFRECGAHYGSWLILSTEYANAGRNPDRRGAIFSFGRDCHCHVDTYNAVMLKHPTKVVRILGVGRPSEDGVTRISQGKHFACFLGSDNEHGLLRGFCADLQALLDATGADLTQFEPEELLALIFAHGLHEGRECAS